MDRNQTFDRVLRLEPGRTALLVIDMQRGVLDPGEAMEGPPAREIIPRIQALLTLFREKRLPVIFTEFAYSQAVPLLVGELHPEHKRALPGNPRGFGRPSSSCLEGEDNVHTISDLAPRPGELVIRKRWYDAFNGTPLDGALRARGGTSLVLTGPSPGSSPPRRSPTSWPYGKNGAYALRGRHPGQPPPLQGRPLDRRDGLPPPPFLARQHEGRHGDHGQRPRRRGLVPLPRRKTPRAGHRAR